jgi:hypothetical protein
MSEEELEGVAAKVDYVYKWGYGSGGTVSSSVSQIVADGREARHLAIVPDQQLGEKRRETPRPLYQDHQ